MEYPSCPDNREDCRFTHEGGGSTMMYSPISYDRKGNPVGGGANRVSKAVQCNKCRKRWMCERTELEEAQGVNLNWEIIS